ncbi:helix-turn-helix domain-containing protein [Gracilibacillus salitolerans]|uniref:Helix-turn-helix domain-containing protein n=1 Tax=Gracilibacillus salitolerans TaxID=2663022 RepID=A0A5Q2TNR1_9BACI|nr:helix-turn-helix domain-containing protein [Gracilibacillus salitolerans]QGH36446.1 helix-turn-helix domain-containing protein [Gracilibacillus salitolerans]
MTTNYAVLIKEALKESNKSMRQLAKETGINVSTISRIINGKRNATLDHLKAISQSLHIPLSDLISSEESSEPDQPVSFHHVRALITEMDLPVKDFSVDRLKKRLQEYQQESSTEEGRVTILHQFKSKMATLGGQGPFIQQLESMYQTFKEKKASTKELLLIGSALFYFIASIDMIPDYLFPIGYLDDALAVQYVMQSLSMKH